MKILSFYSSLKIDRPSVYTQSYKLLTILQQVFCFIMVTTPTQVGFFISLGAGFFLPYGCFQKEYQSILPVTLII